MMELKDYLKELRKEHGYSQEYMASKLNICRQTYSHYETGRIRPPVSAIYKMAGLYHIATESLLDLLVEMSVKTVKEAEPEAPVKGAGTENPAETGGIRNYLDFVNDPFNNNKLKYLDLSERHLLYYYENLNFHDRATAMKMMKVFFENCRKDIC